MFSKLLGRFMAHCLIILAWVLFFVELFSRERLEPDYWCAGVASLAYALTVCYWIRPRNTASRGDC